jgi:hypothetical protein
MERFTMRFRGGAVLIGVVLAAPIVYPPVASADGRSIAYVAREGRDRNIYFLHVGEPARRIANFAGDDGQDLPQLSVSVTGGAVAFVRGGPPTPQGDSPNPRSRSSGSRTATAAAGSPAAGPSRPR